MSEAGESGQEQGTCISGFRAEMFVLESRAGHGGSLGGPRMQQQLFRSGDLPSKLGVPSALTNSLPNPSPVGSPTGQRHVSRQVSREGSPLLSGLEEIRRELAAMRSADGSQDVPRHARQVPSLLFLLCGSTLSMRTIIGQLCLTS
jgi:hypothetical protein